MNLYHAWFDWSGKLEIKEVPVVEYGANRYKIQNDTGMQCFDYRRIVNKGELSATPSQALDALQCKQQRIYDKAFGDLRIAEERLIRLTAAREGL